MNRLLERLLDRAVQSGNLEVVDGDGRLHRFGDGTGPLIRVRFADRKTELAVMSAPHLKLGEAYMNGTFLVEEGSIYDFLYLAQSQAKGRALPWWLRRGERLRLLTRRLHQINDRRTARRNAKHHYDLGNELYELFLDRDMQYSCAYFERPGIGLDEAQLAKKRHIAAKLALLDAPKRVLDIGSGWGGMGLYLARTTGAEVTGVTLAERQHAASLERVREEGLEDLVTFLLKDYRELDGTFDRIVSVGMFEHVGVNHYDRFFTQCRNLLPEDGVMVLHSIGRFHGPGDTNPFIRKYIFPGGYAPSLSEVLPAIERAGLFVTDVEILRLHYAETLRAWRTRFLANRDAAAAMHDERFCRMWEFYLAGCEVGFRDEGLMVFQIQLTKRLGTLPLTRHYMAEAEEELRRRERRGLERQAAAE